MDNTPINQHLKNMSIMLQMLMFPFEAESVAYAVCQYYGIDTSDYSFAYIAGWSQGKETLELKASLNTIRTAASEMIHDIDGHMKELTQEREAVQNEAAYQIGNHYLEIHEASDGSWDYTLYGHNYREVDGGQIGNIETMTMDYAVKEITDFYQLSDQKLIEMNRDKLADLVELYNPAFTDEQIQFMADVIGQGFDSKEYWVGGKPMDLSAERLSSDQIADIKYQVRVDAIPKMLFTKEQWHEIEAGIADKADVTAYADPSLSPEQMRQKRMEMTAPKTPVKEEPVISESDRKTSTKQTGKRKSLLADLREKQARIGGGEAPQVQMKSKSKEME